MKDYYDRTIVLISTGQSIYDDMVYFRYAKSLKKFCKDVYVVGVEDNYNLKDEEIHFCVLPKSKERIKRFVVNPLTIIHYLRRFKPNETVLFLFSLDMVFYGKYLIKKGFHVVQLYVENYPRKIMYKKWIPQHFRSVIAKIVASTQHQLGQKCDANIFMDSLTMSEQGNEFRNKWLLPNYPIGEAFQTDYKSYDLPIKCVYVGSISADRGLLIMKDLIKKTSPLDITLTIYGNCLDETEQKILYEFIKNHSNVFYKGSIPYTEILSSLRFYDLGLAFYVRTEAYSYNGENTTKLFEYMQAGLPVVTQDFPGLKQIIENEDNAGCCFNTDDPYWIDSFMNLVNNKTKLCEMAKNGKKAFITRRNWKCCEAELNKLMRGL